VGELVRTNPTVALAVYAHPDDPEISCGGTLARWAADGTRLHIVVATRGEKGDDRPGTDPVVLAERRAEEAREAAKVLGAQGVELLGYPDGEICNDVPLRRWLVEIVRRVRPDVVLAPDPTAVFFGSGYVNHHDHRAIGWAVLDACAPAAASPLYFPEVGDAHQVGSILLSGTLEPDVWVDITSSVDAKADAVICHTSQIRGQDPEDVRELVRARARQEGTRAGVTFAEGYRRLRLA
jgi:LmbE family N-acetylglucosaminyl deacetylase